MTIYLTDKLKKYIFICLLVVIGSFLNLAENFIPVVSTVPGIKLGISNIVILYIALLFSYKEAVFASLLKTILVTLIFGNGTSFIYSLVGGLLSSYFMAILIKNKNVSPIGASVAGSFFHITAQILVAFVMLKSVVIFTYYPVLLSVSLITGALNGIIIFYMPKILKSGRRF